MENVKEIIKNRFEVLFLYDVIDVNLNGDLFDENKLRIDFEIDICIVIDVCLKRICRDYWVEYKNFFVFILREIFEDGKFMIKFDKFLKYNFSKEKLKDYIDIRFFGGIIILKSKDEKKKSKLDEDLLEEIGVIIFMGFVQFKFGRFLYKVEYMFVKGIIVMLFGEGKD